MGWNGRVARHEQYAKRVRARVFRCRDMVRFGCGAALVVFTLGVADLVKELRSFASSIWQVQRYALRVFKPHIGDEGRRQTLLYWSGESFGGGA